MSVSSARASPKNVTAGPIGVGVGVGVAVGPLSSSPQPASIMHPSMSDATNLPPKRIMCPSSPFNPAFPIRARRRLPWRN
jgi:hypothetical protein